MNTVVSTLIQWRALGSGITELTVFYNSLNDGSLTELDFNRFKRLKKIVIGDECFKYVEVVKLIGLNELESVEIGENSFTKEKNGFGNEPNRHFYLKNCPKLRELIVGRYSFSDYPVLEIEHVDALEEIKMGNVKDESYSFKYASLELKSILIH